ncbi:HEAT repeat domain-containing protein [Planctomycetota bacterium]
MKNIKKKRRTIRNFSVKLLFSGIICALLVNWPMVLADLDINPPPPGTPMELSLGRKTVSPNSDPVTSGMGVRKREKKEKDSQRITSEVTPQELASIVKALKYNLSPDPFEATGITTQDVEMHCPWINAEEEYTNDPDVFRPPDPGLIFRFIIGADYLRLFLHPYGMNKHEVVNHLLDIGQPGLTTAKQVLASCKGNAEDKKKFEQGLNDDLQYVSEVVIDCVGAPAGKLPLAEIGDTIEETFANCLIVLELGQAYLHQPQPGFAKHIEDMGECMVPFLIKAATGQKHKLIRRNAVGILGQMGTGEEVLAALRKVAKGDDMVAAVRAAFALAAHKDKVIVPWLIERIADEFVYKGNPSFRHLAIFCLGVIGHPDAIEPILALANLANGKGVKPQNKREVLWTCLQALARLRANSPHAIKLYRKAAKEYKGTGGCPVGDFAVLAGYACGDPLLQREFKKKISKKNPLQNFTPPARCLAIEVLEANQHQLKTDYLAQIAMSADEDQNIRFQAMGRRKFFKKDVPLLKKIIESKDSISVIQSIALMRLWEFDRDQCRKLAKKLLGKYVSNKKASHLRGEGYEVVMAMRILGPERVLKIKEIIQILERGYSDLMTAKKEAQKRMKGDDPRTMELELILPPPIFSTSLMELGRLGQKEGLKYLVATVLDHKKPNREEAIKGLYLTGGDKAISTFIQVLNAKDRWVRHYAAWALSDLTGVEYKCEWAFGSLEEIEKGWQFWQDWYRDNRKKK